MRLWHYQLFPYLPEAQFRGQLRELVAIMHDWRDKGVTNHLLINKVMSYSKRELFDYFCLYELEYNKRYNKQLAKQISDEFKEFAKTENRVFLDWLRPLFDGWHNKDYLRICMANLYEKYCGVGKSRVQIKNGIIYWLDIKNNRRRLYNLIM